MSNRRKPQSPTTPSKGEFLTAAALVERWGGAITIQTLANWRATNRGPAYFKNGGRVLYRLADVTAYESANMHPGHGGTTFTRDEIS